MSNLFYNFSVLFNGMALLFFFIFAYEKNKKVFKAATGSLITGTTFLVIYLVAQGITISQHPATSAFLSHCFFALIIYLVYFLFEFKFRIRLLGTFIVPIGYFFNVLAVFSDKTNFLQLKSFSKMILSIHSGLLMLGEALFVIAFASSIMYLIQEKNLKSKRFTELYYRLPSLSKLEEMAGFSIMAGFPLITAGILIGFFWAAHMWGGKWYFDPKIIITTISWLIYAVLFYLKATKKMEGKRFVIFVMVCFFLVIVSFALTFSFDSIHSINRKFGVN